MARTLHLDDDGFTVELSGLLALGAFHRRVRVPWAAVRDVRAGALDAPRGRHGRFRRGRRLQFLSFEDPGRVVRVEIDRSVPGAPRFDDVILGDPCPGRMVLEVRRWLRGAVSVVDDVSPAARAA